MSADDGGRPRFGRSLSTLAALLFVATALAPALVLAANLWRANEQAVRSSEREAESAAVAEIASLTLATIREARADAEAAAIAIAEAATNANARGDGLDGVRAVLASRRALGAVRFEVPAAKVSTVIRKEGSALEPPASTPELRARADERGSVLVVTPDGSGVLVTTIPRRAEQGARGYVATSVDLDALRAELTAAVERRFEGAAASAALVDADRKVVAAHGPGAKVGEDGSKLAALSLFPAGTAWSVRVGIVDSFDDGGSRMIGGVESVAELGWAVAVWRSEAVAYASLTALRRKLAVTLAVAVGLALFLGILASGLVTRPVLALSREAERIGRREWTDLRLPVGRGDEIGVLGRSMAAMVHGLEEGEKRLAEEARLRGDLGRFLDERLVTAIVKGEHKLDLGGKRAEITVLFADVVAFSALAQSLQPERVVALLNELFTVLTEVVFRHEGTVDKFVGDAIMAVWGAPVADAEHAVKAIRAAEDMIRFLETTNVGFHKKYGVEIKLAIGVHTGDAIVGNVGSEKRMEYTAIGDTVNVAARLETLATPNQILVSDATRDRVGETFPLTLLGERRLSGREGELRVYELET